MGATMPRQLITPPAVEPLTVAEAAKHVRLDETAFTPTPEAPSVALVSPAAAGSLSAGAYRYRLTFVTADGETDGGQISSVATVTNPAVNGQIRLTQIPLGGAEVTARRIYRTMAGGSSYLLVATIADNATTAYTDTIADAALGVGIPLANTTGDPELRAFIAAARDHVEQYTGRRLITQVWREDFDRFPCDRPLELLLAPVASVDQVQYVGEDGVLTTLDPAEYVVESTGLLARIRPAYGLVWPSTRDIWAAVQVTYTVGYGDTPAEVPASIRAAIKLLLGHLYANREAVITGTIASALPLAVESLLATYRIRRGT
ncbi:MAG: hypothetical protein C0503_02920 [Gemmatimonas sp.]|nr:hypothetical protein [Gemmatimonas sp.]